LKSQKSTRVCWGRVLDSARIRVKGGGGLCWQSETNICVTNTQGGEEKKLSRTTPPEGE